MCFNNLYESFVVVGAKVWTVNGPFGVLPDPSGGWCDNRGFGAVQHGRKTSLVVCLFPFFYNKQSAMFWNSKLSHRHTRMSCNFDLCPVFFRFCDSWGTLTWMAHKKTCLGTTSSKEVCCLRAYGTRSWLRLSIRCGETQTLTTQREAGSCCWRAFAASPRRPRWRSTCWSEKLFLVDVNLKV